jgi:hypothetical protein
MSLPVLLHATRRFRRSYRVLRRLIVVRASSVSATCAAALLLAVLPTAAQAASPAVDSGITYVALGDSYSSGEGNPPFEAGTNTNDDRCHRSAAAYPHILASTYATHPPLFFACSGATTDDMAAKFNTEPSQLTKVGSDANLITLTVGGDDAGFSSVIKACILQKLVAPIKNPGPVGRWIGLGPGPSCADSPQFTKARDQQVLNVNSHVWDVYKTLLAKGDPVHTSIIVADYPHLFGSTEHEQTCSELSPWLTAADQKWMNYEADRLDTTLINTAADAGVNMVDVRGQFAGHGVCGNGGGWINGITTSSGWLPPSGSFHPNASGHAFGYAAAITKYIDNASLVTPEGLPVNPAQSHATAAARPTADTAPANSITNLQVTPVGITYRGCDGNVRAGHRVRVVGSGFAPSTTVTVYTTSPGQAGLEQQVGSVTSDSTGTVDTVVKVPAAATGFHRAGMSGGLIGFDAIGFGTDGASHADALSLNGLNIPPSLCGGAARQATNLTYTGTKHVANGTPAHLSAVLHKGKTGTTPIPGRSVKLTLGKGNNSQACTAKTDSHGTAACPIPVVHQPLNADATVPVSARFAGDQHYLPSQASAHIRLEYYTGRATGITASVRLPLVTLALGPTPDTGRIRTASASHTTTPCAATAGTLLVNTEELCPQVVTHLDPGTAKATVRVADVRIGLPGLPVITLSGLTATSTSTCTTKVGSATVSVAVAGSRVDVPTAPNSTIPLPGGGRIVVNEQSPAPNADSGLTVRAAHIIVPGISGHLVDITIGTATSAAHNCHWHILHQTALGGLLPMFTPRADGR